MSSVIATIVPVFALIALGFLAGRAGYLGEAAAKGLPEFVFKLAMPIMLFRTIGTARMPDVAISNILLSFFGAAAVTWICATIANRLLARHVADGSALGMGSTFSNSVMMGIPICLAHFGPDAAPILALIALCDTAIFWLWATFHLAATEGVGERSLAGLIGNLFLRLATNPIIVGCAAGLGWQVAGLTMPPLANSVVGMLAGAAIPGALVAMGLALNSYSLAGSMPAVSVVTALKLIVMPVTAWVLAVQILHLPPLVAGVVVMLAAMPVGANAYLFATAYDRAPAVVSGAIALSTPLALITLSALLAALGGGAP